MVTQAQQPLNGPKMMSDMALKCLVVYKVVLLENARGALEQLLRDFTSQATDYVQGFLESHAPSKVFNHDDLVLSLDTKCQALDKVLGFFKEITQAAQLRTVKPSGDGVAAGSMTSDVLKIEAVLQNPLVAHSPTTKTQKVLSQPVKQSQIPPKAKAAQGGDDDDVIRSISSSHDDTVVETASPRHLKGEENDASSSCHLKGKEKDASSCHIKDPWVEPPTTVQCPKDNAVSAPPVIKPLNPKISIPKPREMLLDRVDRVQHQKQTTAQLLHFLKTSARNKGVMDVTFIEWRSNADYYRPSILSTRPASPTMRVKNEPLALKRKMIGEVENQGPIFQLKRVNSSGTMTYTYVNATKTELWDVGDIFTDSSETSSTSGSDTTEDNQSEGSTQSDGSTEVSLTPAETRNEKRSVVASAGVTHVHIPDFPIKKLDEMEVVVSHIVSPGKFHVQHADASTRLQAHISDDWKANSSFVEQNCIPDIGTLVMGWIPEQEQWCRACVTKICGMRGGRTTGDDVMDSRPDIEVEVKRLDYGDTCCLPLRNIRELTPELLVLPLQAVQVSLANVTPVDGRYWSEEAVDWFRATVDNRTLYARLYPQGPGVVAELFLDRGKIGTMRRGASLSVRLTQNGHAKHDKLKQFNGMKKRGTFNIKRQESAWEEYLVSFCARK